MKSLFTWNPTKQDNEDGQVRVIADIAEKIDIPTTLFYLVIAKCAPKSNLQYRTVIRYKWYVHV